MDLIWYSQSMEMRQLQIKNLTELEHFAETLLESLADNVDGEAIVIALQGELGAGKTTLVQLFGKLLNIDEPILSPTFTIMKSYEVPSGPFTKLVHMDAYRIDDLAELRPLHFEALLKEPGTLICIEWAEKIIPALPSNRLTVALQIAQGEERTVQVSHLVR